MNRGESGLREVKVDGILYRGPFPYGSPGAEAKITWWPKDKHGFATWKKFATIQDAEMAMKGLEKMAASETASEPSVSKKPVRKIDTEEARRIAAWALGHHQGAREAAETSVLRAIACGVQLTKGKLLLEYGDFGRWWRKYLAPMGHSTAGRYMALVDAIRASVGMCGGEVPAILNPFDVAPQKLTAEYGRTILPRIRNIIEGKTLSQLYQEFGIIKARKHVDDEALARLRRAEEAATDPSDRHEVQLHFVNDLFGDVIERLGRWEQCVRELDEPEVVGAAVDKLTDTLERITGCTVTLTRPTPSDQAKVS
jgi:hypothetical protein